MARASSPKTNIVTGVEFGTSHIKVAIGRQDSDSTVTVLGVGRVASERIQKGEILDLGAAREGFQSALEQAESSAGTQVREVYLAVSGGHIRTVVNAGRVPVQAQDRRVSEEDVVEAVRNANAYSLPPEQRVVNSFDRRYLLDGDREIASPVGHPVGSLEAEVLLAYGSLSRIETPCRVVYDVLGYGPSDIAFSPVAASMAALYPEQLEQGALVIDAGAGVTEYALFSLPGCFHAAQITVGCRHLINDLSIGLDIPFAKAQTVLQDLAEFGSAAMTADGNRRMIEVDTVIARHRRIPAATVEQIIELRVQELFEVIAADVRQRGALPRASCGAVLCGGMARVPGVTDLATNILGMPVRAGTPVRTRLPGDIPNPEDFLVPVGMIRFGEFTRQVGQPSDLSFTEQLKNDVRGAVGVLRRALRW